jgi:transcription termination factor Rho
MAFLRRQIADRSRREGAEQLLRVLEKTKSNAQLIAAILKQE